MKIYNMMMQKMHIELFLEYKQLDFDNYCIYFLTLLSIPGCKKRGYT